MGFNAPASPRVRREVRGWITLAVGLGCFLGGVWATHARHAHASHTNAPATPTVTPSRDGARTEPSGPTEITVVYSTETDAWLRPQVAEFERANRDVRVRLQGMGSLEAERSIADGRVRPTLWAPADTVPVELLEQDWRASHSSPVVARDGSRWPRPLVLTPMVFTVWQSRASSLGDASVLPWSRLTSVARSPRGWASLGAPAAWGSLKFAHTDPTRSHAGLQALVLMAYGFFGRTGRLTPSDVSSANFEAFVQTLEAADTASDRGTGSSGEFAQTVAVQGPGRYDVAMMYESQAIASMEVARGRWGEELRVYYPTINAWSDHPLCLMQGDWVSPAQRSAAERLADFLRGTGAQTAAVHHGFRPAEASVPLVSDDPENPFVRYRSQGVRIALAQVADPPAPQVLEALSNTWRRATGR